jgi:PKD repeat protein
VSFDPGIHPSLSYRLAGTYVDASACVFYPGFPVTVVVRLSTGSYVDPSACCFITGFLVPMPQARLGAQIVFAPPELVTTGSAYVTMFALPMLPGDDSVEIVFGVHIEFFATPRIGPAPLTVQFTQLCAGIIDEYYWRFGDNHRSYHSDPANIYLHPGVYDVYLRIKAEGRYYDLLKKRYIIVLPGGLVVSRTTRLIRQPILSEQGCGFYEMPVTDMPMPEGGGGGVLSIFDTNNQPRGIVLDAATGKWYEVTTRDGPSGTSLVKSWKNKSDEEFDRIVRFREDRGTDEKDLERLVESHLYLRPDKETNRSQTGYDANGYPIGMEFDLAFFKDGEPTNANAIVTDIPYSGDIKIDRKLEGNRIQMQITSNRGAHFILNRLCRYVSSKRAAAPESRISNEMTFQELLAQAIFWMSYCDGILINRITGAELTLDVVAMTGVTGLGNTAQGLNGEITLPNVVITTGAVFFWTNGAVVLTIGGTPVTLIDSGTCGLWTLKYAAITGTSGVVKLTPTGAASIEDLRIFNSSVADALSYYAEDVITNSGAIVLP